MQEGGGNLNDFFKLTADGIQISVNTFGVCIQVGKQGAQVFFKVIRKQSTMLLCKGDQPFFAGMGGFVQGKENVKIGFQEGGYTVIDTDRITAADGLADLP